MSADEYILVDFHHGGHIVKDPIPRYVGKRGEDGHMIDKDHFSLFELLSYKKDMGYAEVEGFYLINPKSNDFVLIENDEQMYNIVCHLNHLDHLDLYIKHVVNEPVLLHETVPCGLLCGPEVVEPSTVPGDINVQESAANNTSVPEENLDDVGVAGENLQGAEETTNIDASLASDLSSSESELDNIPDEDDSDVNEELTSLRPSKEDRFAGKLGGDEDYYTSSDIGSDDSTDELDVLAERGIDLPPRRRSKKVRFDPDCYLAIFELGMVFENAVEFRKAVASYAVENKVQLTIRPNEKDRVRVKCKGAKCNWELYTSNYGDSCDFTVKKYHPAHKCNTKNKNKLCTSKYIANKYKDRIIFRPNIKLWEIQDLVRDKLGLYVGRTVCYRAKCRVISQFMGDWRMEFNRLADYADIIKQTNPGSSCWIRTDSETIPVGRNGNNQIFSIAWVVVDQETKHSWSWFITYLIADLQLGDGVGLTVMSDMQKGLVPTIRELLPMAEYRMCARHIWSNWSKNWRGEERRKQFWRCAKASYEVKFKEELEAMNKLGYKICEDLLKYDKEYWCRAYFREDSKCDVIENNIVKHSILG
uniref:Transposase MuDR plant domain-containing protein n=1 Tax=Nicotiana tabacum TaxID=4097 RepID=A0A1S3ZFT8_TOBAC|nr:PREDICTED: uncharacterized protein LOC107786378 [Nicotiana tabacum]